MIGTGRALLALLVLSLTACALIAPYDRITDERLTELHATVVALLEQLPGASYELARPGLGAVRRELGTLRLRQQARPRSGLMIAQVDTIIRTWDRLEALVKLGPLSLAEVDLIRRTLDVEFRSALAAEIDKGRLLP